jgi:hypothetical protein
MKEIDERIKWSVGRPPITSILLALRRVVASILPPLARSLAGLRDHCIEQHKQGDLYVFAYERRGETG